MILDIARREARMWRTAAGLARAAYRREFGADVEPAPDTFMLLTEEDPNRWHGRLSGAVAGLSFADQSPLFSEHYLDVPIEEGLARLRGGRLERSQILEVGPLASTSPGAGRQLIDIMPAMCWCQGAKVAVFTVTRPLRAMLQRQGIRTTVLCAAEETRLPADMRGIWGSYYRSAPVTVCVDLARHIGQALPLLSGQSTTAETLVEPLA